MVRLFTTATLTGTSRVYTSRVAPRPCLVVSTLLSVTDAGICGTASVKIGLKVVVFLPLGWMALLSASIRSS